MKKYIWNDSSGKIKITLTLSDALSVSHPGRCDEDIITLKNIPYVRKQLDALAPNDIWNALREYGPWDKNDPQGNLEGILWIAAGDIAERPEDFI